MRILFSATALFVLSGPVAAQNVDALLKKHGCLVCHSIDKTLVGPSYKEVASKNSGKKDAEKRLAEKVKKGGVGVWGQVPMPPNPAVPDADVVAIVKWVLVQK